MKYQSAFSGNYKKKEKYLKTAFVDFSLAEWIIKTCKHRNAIIDSSGEKRMP